MNCRVCDHSDLEPVLDLGAQPWCNHFLKAEEVGTESYYPLEVVFCQNCHTAQLSFTVPKEIMFSDHTYLSGITQSLNNHFRHTAETIDAVFFRHKSRKSALDVGSNDGTQLKYYQKLGYDVLGVESAGRIARLAQDAGVPTLCAFFNAEVARNLHRTFDVINASGVFFHLEELHSVTDGIRMCLAPEGVFVIQCLYVKCIMDNLAFDQIYHEHLLYYTLETLDALLSRHGLSIFDAWLSPIHGGSLIALAGHTGHRSPSDRLKRLEAMEQETRLNTLDTYRAFARRVGEVKDTNLRFLNEARRRGKLIYGFGAPAKGNTLLNYFQIGPETLSFLVEKNPLRRGLYSPGMHIPVILEEEVVRPPDIYYVLAWNFRDEILANNRHLLDAGVFFYFPVQPSLPVIP